MVKETKCLWKEHGQCQNPVTQYLAGEHPFCEEHYKLMIDNMKMIDEDLQEKGYVECDGNQYVRGENFF
jgi:hypothetical protein